MSVSLAVVGDVAFAGPLAQDALGAARSIDPRVRQLLAADILIANLEYAMTHVAPHSGCEFDLYGPPDSVEALKDVGISAVSLANTHALDCGARGLALTRRTLQEAGIGFFGAGLNYREACQPLLLDCKGLRLGFLAFHGGKVATARRAGSLPLDWGPSRQLIRRTQRECDFLMVYFHNGVEAFNYPMAQTIKECHAAIEAGADLVVGTHPHTVQGMEFHRGAAIVYSVGNFIIPQVMPGFFERWAAQTTLTLLGMPIEHETIRKALVVRCNVVAPRKAEVDCVPIRLQDTGLPAAVEGEEYAKAVRFFQQLSEPFNHPEDPIWRTVREVERGYWRLQYRAFPWLRLFTHFYRIRWRHVVDLFKTLR